MIQAKPFASVLKAFWNSFTTQLATLLTDELSFSQKKGRSRLTRIEIWIKAISSLNPEWTTKTEQQQRDPHNVSSQMDLLIPLKKSSRDNKLGAFEL